MQEKVMITKRTLYFLVCSAVLAIALTLNFVHQSLAKENDGDDAFSYLKNFTDVVALVQRNYVTDVKLSDLVDGAVRGMLTALDPHSSYLPPEGYTELKVETKGEFGGLGIEISMRDGLLTVVSPIEDSPASRVGIQPGDQIIKIGDEFTRELALADAVKKMRGPKGTPVTLFIHREGVRELIPVTIVRDIIKVKSVRYRMLEDGYGYIRLTQFQEDSSDEFESAVKELSKKSQNKKLSGLVLDLRNDPGGLLNQAIKVSDVFLKDGIVVYTDGRLESQKQKYYAHDDGTEPDYPLIVLINSGSASASEIVAGALQDAGRSFTVGTQSFGKGSVQTILPMDSGAAVRLTTALYFTRNGRSIQAQGITPDLVVQPKAPAPLKADKNVEKLNSVKESDLPGAIKNPIGETPKKEAPKEQKGVSADEDDLPIRKDLMKIPLAELLSEDPQLEASLKYAKDWAATGIKPVAPKEETKSAENTAGNSDKNRVEGQNSEAKTR
jgi:carboxyl-terminal processing protease